MSDCSATPVVLYHPASWNPVMGKFNFDKHRVVLQSRMNPQNSFLWVHFILIKRWQETSLSRMWIALCTLSPLVTGLLWNFFLGLFSEMLISLFFHFGRFFFAFVQTMCSPTGICFCSLQKFKATSILCLRVCKSLSSRHESLTLYSTQNPVVQRGNLCILESPERKPTAR